MNGNGNNGEQFNPPPAGGGRGGQSDAGEDAGEDAVDQFAAPVEAGDAPETAALTEVQDVFGGISMELLEMKRGIEEGMRQAIARPAAARAVDAFGGAGNIQGVSIGLGLGELASGAPGMPALTLYLAEPSSQDSVRAALVDTMGISAAASDSVPINLIVTGVIDAQPHRFRLRPSPAGVSVGHFRITAGSIACLAVGRNAPRNARLLILSNNHVLANSNSGAFGDCITQPGPYDGGRCPADQIATLERYVPINFSGGVNYVDCATGWTWPERVRRELVYLRDGVPTFFRIASAPLAPALGMIVGKSGRTTQLRQGMVVGIGATINVNYGGGRVAQFQDQFAVMGIGGAFSAGGDSGSSIWTWNPQRNPVGLLFAGGNNITFANRMTRVVAALDIALFT